MKAQTLGVEIGFQQKHQIATHGKSHLLLLFLSAFNKLIIINRIKDSHEI